MAVRPLAEQLRDLPKHFPELAGNGFMERAFRDVLLPQVIIKAKRNEAATRKLIVEVLAKCIHVLEIDPAEVVGPPRTS